MVKEENDAAYEWHKWRNIMTLGNKIQEIRTERHMSQEQFGELLDTTRQTVSKWELDQVVPDVRKLIAISRIFCVSMDELLLNVTNFEMEGVPFSCGVYKKGTTEIVETEKLALEYYAKGKHLMGAKAYKGSGDQKILCAICEKDTDTERMAYAYMALDENGKEQVVSNCTSFDKLLGMERMDRKRLEKMDCVESFLVNHGEYPLHTVYELGIRRCLVEWNRGVRFSAVPEYIFVNLHTNKKEYIFQIGKQDDNVYCGISYNIPFDLGIRSYGQYYRLRNYKDNSEPFCCCYYDFDYQMPNEKYGIDCVKLACNTIGQSNYGDNSIWFVKRYSDDEIVLDGCRGEEYVFSRTMDMFERFA